jgi:fumarate reductase flavoprotein subunit
VALYLLIYKEVKFMETKEKKNLKKQLVIIGGGGTGLAAAVTAAEHGLSDILVLEKRGAIGGISAMAVGPLAADSPAHKRQRIIATKDEIYKKALEWGHLKVNPRIVRAFIDKSGETIEWLENKGLFFRVLPHSALDHPHVGHVSLGMGAEITKLLAAECKRLGVEIRTRTPAKKILLDKNGSVNGVVASDSGTEITINTNSVIICTGGYAGNKELMGKYGLDTENMEVRGIPHTGDGLVMATGIGAATDSLGILLVEGPGPSIRAMMKIGTGKDVMPLPLGSIAMGEHVIWVNKFGKRFVDESSMLHIFESSNAVRRQPHNLVYSLIDSGMVRLTKAEFNLLDPNARAAPKLDPDLVEGAVKQAVAEDNGKLAKIANSWKEIAVWIGCDPQVLQSTIDEYNEGCNRGHDAIFAKDQRYLMPLLTPPFYAFKCGSGIMNTLGGIKINEKMEVLNQDDLPIPGLYAGGNDAGGWTSDTYCTAQPGSAFGFALNSGRIAGESASEYANGKK